MANIVEQHIGASLIGKHNAEREAGVAADCKALGEHLSRRGIDYDRIAAAAASFEVAVPTWGVGTGGTRFARFPGPGEPRGIHDKLADCAVIQTLVRCTPRVSPHYPWDKTDDPAALAQEAAELGLGFDAINSNTFQDQPEQKHSYKFGSLTHTDAAVREQAVEHNIACIAYGSKLGSKSITVWIADGSNFPGQQDHRAAFARYLASCGQIRDALPADWIMLLEHKLYEPAFYATVIADWGSSLVAAQQLGDKARCLVDMGHHAPGTNIEQIVARLLDCDKLGGFHFNDSKYGDDDLDSGALDPFQSFLVFCELAQAKRADSGFSTSLMMDQSHNVTDPIESLICSAIELQRAHVHAQLVDYEALAGYQQDNDALMAASTLREAFTTDVGCLLAQARMRTGGAADPIACYRESGWRAMAARERPTQTGSGGGIV